MSWKGEPYEELNFLKESNSNVPRVISAPQHTVLFELPLPDHGEPIPLHLGGSEVSENDYLIMPHSPSCLYPRKGLMKLLNKVPRWQIICDALKKPIKTAEDLCEAIYKYNHTEGWRFDDLTHFIEKEMTEDERKRFFETTLPGIIKLALSLPNVVRCPIPFLQKDTNISMSMSQKQAACLLANAFLCTFPQRNVQHDQKYQGFSFYILFSYGGRRNYEKLKCYIAYFDEVISNGRDGVLTFYRRHVTTEEAPEFLRSSKKLTKLHITSEGGIENADCLLKVDFADKYIGGIILADGLAQEEILFLHYPELTASLLFTEVLGPQDVLFFIGAERFNDTTGYESSFRWCGLHKDSTSRDEFRRRLCQIVALDAIPSRNPCAQYQENHIRRELIKAYVGFCCFEGSDEDPCAIATGNWGCGVFKGNPYIKSLIQFAAAAEAGRDVAYFTFKDEKLRDDVWKMFEFLRNHGVTVGRLVETLFKYGELTREAKPNLYHYIESQIQKENS